MPKREIGLMGYVGEAVVSQWLETRFPEPQFEILTQIMPTDIPKHGGPYLDFGIVHDGVVVELFEVKSQDIIWEENVNLALRHIWEKRGELLNYVTQDGRSFKGTVDTRARLILLGPPNSKGMERIGEKNLEDVMLFEEVMDDLKDRLDVDRLLATVADDVPRVLSILRHPSAGPRIKPEFLKRRAEVASQDVPPTESNPLD